MDKNHFVLTNMGEVLEALTRGLDLDILARGHGVEERGVPVSYQAQAPVIGLVLPSNSPGVHTLWMPVIPLQIGLVFKPGPQEPWTPYRMTEAFAQAGVPREAISIYPGEGDIGAAVLAACSRSMIFGGADTVARYQNDPRVQTARPRFQQDPARRRRRRRLGAVPRRDGRQRPGQQRPELHLLLRRLGLTPHGGDRPGPGRAGWRPSCPGRPTTRNLPSPPSPCRAWPRRSTA